MCNKNFNPNVKNLKKLHYHYHFNGRYQKAEHSICNLDVQFLVNFSLCLMWAQITIFTK